jgi:4-amino-4-deoxy-L-arabinose transferase-like glycosyltransferase
VSQQHDTSSTITPALTSHSAIPWAGELRATILLILGLLALRLIYQITLCPYGLVGDEAHYWEWSRHPSLSYYTKGPGVGWTIFAATTLLGHAEWAIRTPAAIASALTMFAVAMLATSCAKGDRRVGFLAAALVALVPGYQAIAMLMTIDGPYVACWALASWAGWCAMKPADAQRQNNDTRLVAWACVGAAIGAGFLYKYTILLLALGLLIYAVLAWRASRSATGPSQKNWLGPVVALLVLFVCISPVFIWNHQHHWPTLRHLLGHLRVEGGDLPVRHESYTPWWTAHFFLTQAGLLGPVLAAMVMICIVGKRDRSRDSSSEDRRTRTYLLCCGLPVVLFYFGVSLRQEIEGNWPIAGYVTLLVLVAMRLMRELDHHASITRAWLDLPANLRNRVGWLRRGPETLWQVLWHWALGVGVVSLLALAYLPAVAALPVVGKRVPMHRLMGQRQAVTQLAGVIEAVQLRDGVAPLIFTDHYSRASSIAYYLPGQPRVFSATSRLGGRRSAYDFFPDTDLTSPELRSKNVVLVGGFVHFEGPNRRWHEAFSFRDITPAMINGKMGPQRAKYRDLNIWIASDYQGPLVPAEGTSPGKGQPPKKAQEDDGPTP